LVALQPEGQQPSPFEHMVIGLKVQERVHAVPVSVSVVQTFPSLQDVGQFPSQASPASTKLFQQTPTQLLSLVALQPDGQQPSPLVHDVIAVKVHARVHPVPVNVSAVHELPSVHEVGQLPSQVSPASTTPFPQVGTQLLSLLALHPLGQHASPPVHIVIGAKTQARVQPVPVSVSAVHELPSVHEVGQLPSQVSPASTTPFPTSACSCCRCWRCIRSGSTNRRPRMRGWA
jgi:hypothetical protein